MEALRGGRATRAGILGITAQASSYPYKDYLFVGIGLALFLGGVLAVVRFARGGIEV